jgi:hypothetical protein
MAPNCLKWGDALALDHLSPPAGVRWRTAALHSGAESASDRYERIEELRQAIAAGLYRVDSQTIAHRMLERWGAEGLPEPL